jgi:hypothetical protein
LPVGNSNRGQCEWPSPLDDGQPTEHTVALRRKASTMSHKNEPDNTLALMVVGAALLIGVAVAARSVSADASADSRGSTDAIPSSRPK